MNGINRHALAVGFDKFNTHSPLANSFVNNDPITFDNLLPWSQHKAIHFGWLGPALFSLFLGLTGLNW